MIAAVVAEFADPDALVAAIERVRAAGYRRIDAYTPFPLAEVDDALDQHSRPIAWIAGLSAVVGAAAMAAMQWWAGIDYPLDIGGRPIFPWPAFVSTTVIGAILWAALGSFVGLLALLRLPRFHHPAFDIPGFEKLWERRFYLFVDAADPRFEAKATAALLAALRPHAVHEIPG